MRPVKPLDEIEGERVTFGANQNGVLPLPAVLSAGGEVRTCWRPTLLERLALAFGAKLIIAVKLPGTLDRNGVRMPPIAVEVEGCEPERPS